MRLALVDPREQVGVGFLFGPGLCEVGRVRAERLVPIPFALRSVTAGAVLAQESFPLREISRLGFGLSCRTGLDRRSTSQRRQGYRQADMAHVYDGTSSPACPSSHDALLESSPPAAGHSIQHQ